MTFFLKFDIFYLRMNSKIKTIIFDLGGVLINLNFKKSFEAFNKAGIKNLEELIFKSGPESVLSRFRLGNISTEEFRNYIRQEINEQITDQEIDHMWNQMLIDIPHEKLDLLIELHKKYKIYALSNTNELHWQYSCEMFKYHGLTVNDFFDKIFLSFEMHKEKPNLDIFEEMIKKTNLIPNESLFIDDSASNCQAAEVLGIKSYCYHIGDDLNLIKKFLE